VTWLGLPPDTGFGVHNLPFGIFSVAPSVNPRVGVAIGDRVLDVAAGALGRASLHALSPKAVTNARAHDAKRTSHFSAPTWLCCDGVSWPRARSRSQRHDYLEPRDLANCL